MQGERTNENGTLNIVWKLYLPQSLVGSTTHHRARCSIKTCRFQVRITHCNVVVVVAFMLPPPPHPPLLLLPNNTKRIGIENQRKCRSWPPNNMETTETCDRTNETKVSRHPPTLAAANPIQCCMGLLFLKLYYSCSCSFYCQLN